MDTKKAAQDRRRDAICSIGECDDWTWLTREQHEKLCPGFTVKTILIDGDVALLLFNCTLSIISLCFSLYACFG